MQKNGKLGGYALDFLRTPREVMTGRKAKNGIRTRSHPLCSFFVLTRLLHGTFYFVLVTQKVTRINCYFRRHLRAKRALRERFARKWRRK